ncbi:deoxyribonuclease IV [Alienimonas chondri]|uniref:Probable endonuclease 4 n=1 Tax=Alienimonas chondri TaxID=2681879 RepID=A0ABX1VIT4_9PLAN|nr:deoxyribonuclease IV [Alienimonas chondri]NNJ27750.1 Endonuclease 4 [Alienimonas chondri]
MLAFARSSPTPFVSMPLFGSHLSVAGGFHNAATRAGELDLAAVQIFTKSNHRWAAKTLTDHLVEEWNAARSAAKLKFACSHASYLINFATPEPALRQKSVDAMVIELERADALGLSGVVVHPGSHVRSGEDVGLAAAASAVAEVLERARGGRCGLWLENTAGQGTNLGHQLSHLGAIIDGVPEADRGRLGVCFDTCHAFAAGYDLRDEGEYARTFEELDEAVGLDRLACLHINDSKGGLGSRLDRHEHIGEGELGDDGFRGLMNDPRWAKTPFLLETPKKDRDGVPWDTVNVKRLQSLVN